MSLFNNILNNIKKKYDEKNLFKLVIKETIKEILNIDINEDSISLSNGVLFIKINPTQKMSILLKKNLIIEELNKNNIKVIDIK